MAKSPIQETHNLKFVGILNTDTDEISMEFEELGIKTIRELIEKFNGEVVDITVKLKNEITE